MRRQENFSSERRIMSPRGNLPSENRSACESVEQPFSRETTGLTLGVCHPPIANLEDLPDKVFVDVE